MAIPEKYQLFQWVILIAFLGTVTCSSPSEQESRWAFFTEPDLPLPATPAVPSHIPQSLRAFDREHLREIRSVVDMLEPRLDDPRKLCDPATGELRSAVMTRMGAIDPLMDQSWALPKLRRVLDMLTVTYRALGCPTTPPDSAVLDDARLKLDTVRTYLNSL